MSKCYYCGSVGRGCPECNANSRVGGKTEALQLAAAEQAHSEEMHREAYGRRFMTSGEIMEWGRQVAIEVGKLDDRIHLEVVSEPSRAKPGWTYTLFARTEFPEEPEASRRRVQCWDLRDRLMRPESQYRQPSAMARFIVDYWQRRRLVAAEKREAAAKDFQVKHELTGHFKVTPEVINQLRDGRWDNLEPNSYPHTEDAVAYTIYNACPPATWSLEQIQDAVKRVEAKYGKIEAKAWGGRIAVSMEQLNDKLREDFAIKMRTYWDEQVKQHIHSTFMTMLRRNPQ